jgi:hypothetical protein
MRYRTRVLRANHAVRLGLRAASRNPELAFWKALLDQAGALLALLPTLLAGLLMLAAADRLDLAALLRALRVLRWPVLGGSAAALLLAFTLGMLFWAGALPLIAADAEMDRRPPAGNFWLLAAKGFPRVVAAGAAAYGLSLLFSLACAAALLLAVPAALARPSTALLGSIAAVASAAIVGSVLVDLLARLWLVRAAAFGEGAAAALGKAASLLGARLGALVVVSIAFLFLEMLAAFAAATFTGFISSSSMFDPDAELLALAPRAAVGLAFAAVFAWLEVGRMGALAAVALDAEGLIAPPTPPEPAPEPAPLAEPVIEALPVEDEPR